MSKIITYTKPIFNISKLVAAAPYTILKSGSLKWSIAGVFYAIPIIFSTVFLQLYVVFAPTVSQLSPFKLKMSLLGYSLILVLYCFIYLISLATCFIRFKNISDVLNIFVSLERLANLNCSSYRALGRTIAVVLASVLFPVILFGLQYRVIEHYVYLISGFFIDIVGFIGVHTIFLQFITFVYIIKLYFSCVNNNIIKIHNQILFNNSSHASLNLLENMFYNTRFLQSELNKIFHNYDRLLFAASEINKSFSFQMLLYLVGLFVDCVFCLHYFLSLFMLLQPMDCYIFIHNVLIFMWDSIKMVSLVVICVKARNEANRTAILVHKLINKVTDHRVKGELQLFSLQLLHRKVEFTACGFFPLDFTLLFSIVGAATTYLVIPSHIF